MRNITSQIAHITPVFGEPAIISTGVPPLLEELMDVNDINNYVRHMFSGNKPLLTREELEVCDRATN